MYGDCFADRGRNCNCAHGRKEELQMFKEFFEDIKLFEKESTWLRFKWMKFEFYFRQPFGMVCLLALIIYRLIQNDSREGYSLLQQWGFACLFGCCCFSFVC